MSKTTEKQAKRNLAANVSRLMTQHNHTQVSLAAEAGISQGYVSKILQAVRLPNALIVQKVANVLGTTSDDLLDFPRKKTS